MSQKFSSRAALSMMVFILVLTPMSPFSEMFITEAEANSSSRHIYTFSDGSVENIALYQGGADKTTVVAMPKGAEVLDVQVTLSGASSTGWSQVSTDTYEEWMDGVSSQSDARSGDLTLGFDDGDFEFSPHGMSEDTFRFRCLVRQWELCNTPTSHLKFNRIKVQQPSQNDQFKLDGSRPRCNS